ncbi:unnamed protein product [Ceratitis capitata]|uniref:(Mediterranean fruit fly) hypothetical protein n=1 Tax=Ceratitis capitata TaxID=7213 RepID=A0A811USX4_CERCA|nr:unnamed protein product [Ceratitis capitata]
MASGHDIDDPCSKVNGYPADLFHFFSARQLRIQPTKSSATLCTSWTMEPRLELDVKIDDTKIPTVNNLKIFGVNLDSLHYFTPHTTAIAAKLQSRNKILKALAGST